MKMLLAETRHRLTGQKTPEVPVIVASAQTHPGSLSQTYSKNRRRSCDWKNSKLVVNEGIKNVGHKFTLLCRRRTLRISPQRQTILSSEMTTEMILSFSAMFTLTVWRMLSGVVYGAGKGGTWGVRLLLLAGLLSGEAGRGAQEGAGGGAHALKAHIPGDIILGGLFPIHVKVSSHISTSFVINNGCQ